MKPATDKPTLTPKLRFPEFRDAPGWDAEQLATVASLITERAGDKACIPMSITSGVGLVSQQDKFGRTIAGNQYKNYLVLQRNDFAYNKSATKEFPQGFIAMYSGDESAAVPNSIFTCFRVNEDRIVPDFLNYLFLGNLHGKWLKKYIEVSARAHGSLSISDEDLLSLPVPLPSGELSRAEQTKIASCLSSLDDLIAAESQKLGALKAHKKGLMQQLFPRAGETRPRLRFPEFRKAGEWEEKEIGTIMPVTSSKRVHESEWSSEGVPFYRAREIVALSKGQTISPLHISEDLYDANIKLTGDIRVGHLLVTGVGSIGVPYLVREGDRFYFKDGNIVWLKNDETQLSGEFLFRLYEADFVQTQIRRMSDVGTVATYTIDGAKRTRVVVPRDANEQRRIASCLTSLDDLIAAQGDKLAALKTHKKGLMQQLFPLAEGSANMDVRTDVVPNNNQRPLRKRK